MPTYHSPAYFDKDLPRLLHRYLVTVQQHHIFGRSARLTYTRYAAPVRLSKSAALLNGYSPVVLVL